jgi:O-antigen/teichoic acid export membrane protein
MSLRHFLFKNTSTKQTVTKNIFWLIASETLGRPLRMILIIYAARVLGVSGWGVFSYAISVGTLIMTFSDIGLGGYVTREISQRKEGHQAFVSSAFFLKGALLLASTLLVIVVGPLISHIAEAKALFPLIALVLFFDSLRNFGFAINLASEKMETEMLVTVITNAVILVLGIVLLKHRPVPTSMAIAYAIGSAAGFIAIAYLIRKDIARLIGKVDRKTMLSVVRTTWALALVTLIGSIMANTDIYMLGIWKTPTEVGLYASAQRIQQFILMLPSMIATTTFPLLSRLAHADKGSSRTTFEKTLSFVMIVGIPIACGGGFFARDIILLIFGADYIGAVPIFQVLIATLLAAFPLVILSNAVFAFNKQKSTAFAYAFGVAANIALNLLLIPKLGAVGSAIATAAATIIITSILWKKLKSVLYFEIAPRLKKTFLAVLIMISITVLLKQLGVYSIVNMLISAFVYFGALIMFKEPALLEIRNIFKSTL